MVECLIPLVSSSYESELVEPAIMNIKVIKMDILYKCEDKTKADKVQTTLKNLTIRISKSVMILSIISIGEQMDEIRWIDWD